MLNENWQDIIDDIKLGKPIIVVDNEDRENEGDVFVNAKVANEDSIRLMLNEGREYMFFSPWLLAWPGTGLFLIVLAINLFGDGLRDVTLERER